MRPNSLLPDALFALALGAVVLASPAAAHPGWRPHAHPHAHPYGGWTPVRAEVVRDDINRLDADIDRAAANDTISGREAADLRARLRSLRDQFQRFNRNGLTRGETNALLNRANYIRDRLRMERYDWDRHPG